MLCLHLKKPNRLMSSAVPCLVIALQVVKALQVVRALKAVMALQVANSGLLWFITFWVECSQSHEKRPQQCLTGIFAPFCLVTTVLDTTMLPSSLWLEVFFLSCFFLSPKVSIS